MEKFYTEDKLVSILPLYYINVHGTHIRFFKKSHIQDTWESGVLKKNNIESPLDTNQIEGRYSNYFRIGFNAFEFLLDFSQMYPEDKEAKLHTRIITSPAYVKSLSKVLCKSIKQYERTFGAIEGE